MIKILSFFFILFHSYLSLAHPTSFKGSLILETKSSSQMTDWGLGYSFLSNTAIWGKTLGFDSLPQNRLNLIQVNHLIKRWNAKESQGNLYIGYGLGKWDQNLNPTNSNPTSLGFLQADWETREVYFMFDHQTINEALAPYKKINRIRVGLAPYLVDFDHQSAWIIFEGAKHDETPTDWRVLLRLYYQNVLWEMGTSINHGFIFNLMTHF